jgi:pyridoxamine 5'-phosphate oxidase
MVVPTRRNIRVRGIQLVYCVYLSTTTTKTIATASSFLIREAFATSKSSPLPVSTFKRHNHFGHHRHQPSHNQNSNSNRYHRWFRSIVCLDQVGSSQLTRQKIITPFMSSSSMGQADIGKNSNNNKKDSANISRDGAEENQYLPDGSTSWRLLLERSSTTSRHIRGSNYVQLATVDFVSEEQPTTSTVPQPVPVPKCRSIVFRGFVPLPPDHALLVNPNNSVSSSNNTTMATSPCDGLSCVMKMITDMRSQKVSQLTHPQSSQMAELLWWFPHSMEQYRVAGQILFVGAGKFPLDKDVFLAKARQEMWEKITDAARQSFLSEPTPGQTFSESESETKTSPLENDKTAVEAAALPPPPDNFLLMLLLPKSVDYLRLNNMYRQIDRLDANGVWTSQRVNP